METTPENLTPVEQKEVEERAKKISVIKTGLGKKEKIVIFCVLGGTIILLVASGLLIYFQLTGIATPVQNTNIPTIPVTNTNSAVNTTINTNTSPVLYDQDKDGLPDEEEQTIWRTNIKNKDTDDDGLTDFDEVRTYNTDPLNSDTDADSFPDGEEVNKGYNPLGTGKL